MTNLSYQNKKLDNKTILIAHSDTIHRAILASILFVYLADSYQPGKSLASFFGERTGKNIAQRISDLYKQTIKPEPVLDILDTEEAEEAIQLSQSGKVNLILMDTVKVGDDLRIIQRLKSNPKTTNLPFVLYGSNGLESWKQYLLKSGVSADAYIQQPIVEPQQFANTIRDLLSQQN